MVIVKYLLMVSVISLMLGVGLRTTFGEIIDVAKQFRLVMRGVLANFLVVPLLFYLAVQFLPFRPDVVIGLLVMAAVPIAPMAPPFVGMAKGDVIYAVGLMTIVALLCVPLTPAILILCLPKSEAGLEISTIEIIGILLTTQLIPIGLGMASNHFSRQWADKLLLVVPKIGQVRLVGGSVSTRKEKQNEHNYNYYSHDVFAGFRQCGSRVYQPVQHVAARQSYHWPQRLINFTPGGIS